MSVETAAAYVLAGALGAVVGSFLNVCIHRLPKHESVVRPRSRCPGCDRSLGWVENIPVLSWIVLRARCRGCGTRISVMYPAVELLTAATFVAAYAVFGPTLLLVSRLMLASALIVLAVTDLRDRLLPNAITYPGVVAGLLFALVLPPGLADALLGVVIGAGVPFLIGEAFYRLRGIEGLGMGDVKMLAMVGAFLGWQLTFMTLMLASIAGSVIGGAMILLQRGGMKTALPFGTFLAVGAALAATVGLPLLDWYIHLW